MAVRLLATGTVMVDVLAVDLPRVAEPGEVIYTPREIETRIGGHPVDVVIDLIKLGMPTEEVAVVAALGRGPYASHARSVMDHHGVTSFVQQVPDHDTGKNLVLEVTGEDRRFHIDPGANWYLDPGHVAEVTRRLRPEILCLRPGYTGIDLHLEEILGGLGETVVFLDVMVAHPDRPPGYLLPALRRAHMVHCNEREAQAATGADTAERAVAAFLEAGVEIVFLTSGDRGATATTSRLSVTQPGFRVDAVDATGCGDAFCAGVTFELLRRHQTVSPAVMGELDAAELAAVLATAQAVGASAATRPGCVEGVSRATVDALVEEQGADVLARTRTTDLNRD